MDVNFLTRIESHAGDLFELGQQADPNAPGAAGRGFAGVSAGGAGGAGLPGGSSGAAGRGRSDSSGSASGMRRVLSSPRLDAASAAARGLHPGVEENPAMRHPLPLHHPLPGLPSAKGGTAAGGASRSGGGAGKGAKGSSGPAGGGAGNSGAGSSAGGESPGSTGRDSVPGDKAYPPAQQYRGTRWRALSKAEMHRSHYDDLFGCVMRNFGKGFVCFGLFRVTLNASRVLFGLLRGRGLPPLSTAAAPAAAAAAAAAAASTASRGRHNNLAPSPQGFVFVLRRLILAIVGDAQSWGMFGGALLSILNGYMFFSRHTPKNSVMGRYRGQVAGMLAGLSLTLAPADMRATLAIFLAVRALEVQGKLAANRGFLPALENGDALLMSAASAVVMAAYVVLPRTLEPAYIRFLNTHIQTPPVHVHALRRMVSGRTLDLTTPVNGLNAVRARHFPRGSAGAKPLPAAFARPAGPGGGYDAAAGAAAIGGSIDGFAQLLHPGESTLWYFVKRWFLGFKLSVPVYVPVYLTSTLLFSASRLLTRPLPQLQRVAKGIAVSSLFLTTYTAIGVSMLPVLRWLGLRYSVVGPSLAPLAVSVAGMIAGFSVLLEKKSRRIELALFVFQKAIDVVWNLASNAKGPWRWLLAEVVTGLPGQVLLFSTALGSIMHAFVRHPHMIRGTYRSMLRRFFDSDTRHTFYFDLMY